MYDVVIIGGGPAGLTAAIYAVRKRIKTLLITKELGGQSREANIIDNYPGLPYIKGFELADVLVNHLKKFLSKSDSEKILKIKEGELVKNIQDLSDNKFKVISDKGEYLSKTIIVATGRQPRRLNVPGSKKFDGKGVVYCATCDAPLFRDKIVAVIGAGNAALDAAVQLISYAKKIYILNRRPTIVRADKIYVEKIRNSDKVVVINNAEIKSLEGQEFVKGLRYFDKSSNREKELSIEGIFVEIGSVPAISFLNNLVKTNEYGEIIIDYTTNETSHPGIFAAGDVTIIPYKQLIIAAAEGAKSALAVYNHLQIKQSI